MSGPPLSEAEIRALVRNGIEHGHLPIMRVAELDGGFGQGDGCSVCEQKILKSQVEYEIRGPRNRLLRFHIKCFAVWQLECARHMEAKGGAPSPDARMRSRGTNGNGNGNGSQAGAYARGSLRIGRYRRRSRTRGAPRAADSSSFRDTPQPGHAATSARHPQSAR
jgi:hypothetical protein